MDPALLELIAAGSPDDDVAIIVRLHPGSPPPPGLRIVSQFGDVATGRAARSALAAIHDHPFVASLKAPRIYAGEAASPFADRPPPLEPGLSEADPTPVDSDVRRPEHLAETGKGVIIAVIDWGIDFAHPDFRERDGRTRLLALWDQRAEGHPAPYGYGRIHHRPEIDRALAQSDPFTALGYAPSLTPLPCHGTHVLGIAAGNGRSGGPAGIAPEADLMFVHLGPGLGDLGNSIDLLEAIDFIRQTAGERPVVINMSIGRHAGPHDGSLLIERAIDWLIVNRPGTVVVQSTGNYFSKNTHMEGQLREARTSLLPFELPRSDPFAATVELWYKGADRFEARAIGPDGSSVTAALGESATLGDASGQDIARLYHRQRDPNNGDNLIALVLRPMAPAGRWTIEITGVDIVDGRWHAWIERNAGNPRAQATFPPDRAARGTTTGSICNAMRTIAVGAYDAHDPERPLARFSSVGPTRDGRRKPLLAAPGVRVLSVRSRLSPLEPPDYVRMSGTSMAAPHVAGTVALMLQASGRQPVAAIRRALFANLDTPPAASGNDMSRWGYGVLNIEAAVAAARRLRTKGARPPAETGPTGRPLFPFPAQQETLVMEYDPESREAYEADPAPAATSAPTPPAIDPDEPVVPEPMAVSAPLITADDPAIADPTLGADPLGLGATLPSRATPSAPASPQALVNMAVNPQVSSTHVVGYPGARLAVPLLAGDIILRGDKHKRRAKIVSRGNLRRSGQLRRAGGRGRPREGGFYAEVFGEDAFERIAGPDGLLLSDVMIVRSTEGMEGVASDPPSVPRPTVRQGSRGPAVAELQNRLNDAHGVRLLAGEPGIAKCPLDADGVFGANTRAAVVSFQRIAFPGEPAQWDGVVGPRSWQALLSRPGGGTSQITLPKSCPGLPKEQVIDRFEFNKSEVLPRHQPQIVGIARCIIESQKTATPIKHLTLIGHTDPVGSDPDNVGLGLRRAEAVRKEILDAVKRISGKPAPSSLVIDVESRGEREPAGDDASSRRVQVLSDFEFNPVKPKPPVAAATIEFVTDDDDDHRVDGKSPVATALRFGLWDQAYDGTAARKVLNEQAETKNFVGLDRRRFYLRVTDRSAKGSTVTAKWRTLNAAGGNDDAPASQDVTLTETAAGSKIFVSRALMLVSDDTDAKQPTHSGLASGPDANVRNRGQSNHRLRRAALDGSVRADYSPAGGGSAVSVTLPVFQRKPETRRRVTVRVVHLGITVNAARQTLIDGQFTFANQRYAQVGLRIDAGAAKAVALPAAARDADGNYIGDFRDAREAAVIALLLPDTPDNSVTVCFCTLPRTAGFNAYATVVFDAAGEKQLGNRFFIFQHVDLNLELQTLAHELHHCLHNRFDSPQDQRFFTFNTNAPGGTLPDVRTYRRIQTRFTPNPDADPKLENTFNWTRRLRTTRIPVPFDLSGLTSAVDSTGNTLTGPF